MGRHTLNAHSNHKRVNILARWVAPSFAAALIVAACAGEGMVSSTTPFPTTTQPATVTVGPRQPGTTIAANGCDEPNGFVDAGRVIQLEQTASDTSTLGLISWQQTEGCERFTVRFETTEGAPATTPPNVTVEFLASRQVLRVTTDATATVATDQLVETSLVDRLYVVRGLDGGLFIDLHLVAPAQARAEVSRTPAQLTIDLEAGVEPFDSTAVVSENAVVTSPQHRAQVAAGTVVEIAGYARVFEGNVLVRASLAGETVAETAATAADWAETWGEFATTMQLPAGVVTLFVGEENPEDGSLIGVELSLTVR